VTSDRDIDLNKLQHQHLLLRKMDLEVEENICHACIASFHKHNLFAKRLLWDPHDFHIPRKREIPHVNDNYTDAPQRLATAENNRLPLIRLHFAC
jgi:hypothetical protein